MLFQVQLIKGFISCTRCAWARTHEMSKLAWFVECYFEWMLEIRRSQKNCPQS